MKIQFIKQCGHRKEGSILEVEHLAAAQYLAGGFAVAYVEPKPEPKPEPKKAASKPKAKKE
jgi:hypothetical protein